jgi:hypothetical protein
LILRGSRRSLHFLLPVKRHCGNTTILGDEFNLEETRSDNQHATEMVNSMIAHKDQARLTGPKTWQETP